MKPAATVRLDAAPSLRRERLGSGRCDDQALHARVVHHYRGRLRRYAQFKLRHDPVYAAVAARVAADGPVLDIGCGIGLLGCWLRACGHRGSYLGIDFDDTKIAEARRIADAGALALAFEARDAGSLPQFDGTVALLDVLHYLEREPQRMLLEAAARRVAGDGRLIVRTVLREPAWRFYATVCEEHLLHGCGWMRSPARHYPLRADLVACLGDAGLDVQVRPFWGRTPFASFLIEARRRER